MNVFIGFIIIIFPVAFTILLVAYIYSNYARYEITANSLKLYGIYGKNIKKEFIIRDGIRIINLYEKSDYTPYLRTNAIGFPRYYEGWFRLKNREKALVLIRGKTKKAVYIPTRKNFSVILGTENPEGLVKSLNETYGDHHT
jgi:PH (Pleckstrin Homology) domain-containing protein